MILRATFKCPDAIDTAIDQAQASGTDDTASLREEGYDRSRLKEELARWVKWGEYVTVEFDTELGTATVIPNKTR